MNDDARQSPTTDAPPPFLKLDRPDAAVTVEATADGGFILSCPRALPDYPDSLLEYLIDAAASYPERTFLAQRASAENGDLGAWTPLTYARCKAEADAIAQSLLNRGHGPERPIMILSENSLAQASFLLGGMSARVPMAPISPAYSLLSSDFAKLRHIFDLIKPGLIFVEDGDRFAAALAALDTSGVDIVAVTEAPDGAFSFNDLVESTPTPLVEESRRRIGPDTVGKILFTSGSTGLPKGVINTHRMLCVVQAMIADISHPRAPEDPAVVLDWLPWHHTFGGNATFNAVLRGAGTLYIDAGRPTPGLFDLTIRNLHDISPTYFSCVPGAYTMLAAALEKDDELCAKFFRRLQGMSYGGAALPQALYARMQALAIKTTGHRLHLSTGYGATETGALNTSVYWATERMGLIGLPLPGVRLKLVPSGDKFEVRIKGRQIMPGYYNRPDLDAEAFDEDGWFKSGDAVVWADPDDPLQGLAFAGRVAEDFKLTTGTWVHTGALRMQVLAALSPLADDALVTGQDRDFVGLLIWPSAPGLKSAAPDAVDGERLNDRRVIAALRKKLAAYNALAAGSSARIGRIMLMAEPPSIDAGEITDKRYINQRAALERRADLIERLYAETPDDAVIVI
jgi:feruloyl-CoA synthase